MPITDQHYVNWFSDVWKMSIENADDGYMVDGYYIRPETVIKTHETLVGPRECEAIEWVVSAEEVTTNGHWEPDDIDEVELARESSLGNAFAQVMLIQHEQAINDSLDNLWECVNDEDFERAMS